MKPEMQVPDPLGGERKGILVLLVMNALAQALVAVGTMHLVRYAFDHLVREGKQFSGTALFLAVASLVALAVAMAWLRYRERIDAERMGQDYAHEVRMVLYDRLVSLPPRELQRKSHGAMALRFVGDLVSLRRWVSQGFARLIVVIVMTTVTMTAILFLDWPLALAMALALGMGTGVLGLLNKALRETTQEARKRLSRIAANVTEKMGTVAVVQVFGQSRRERKRLADQSMRYRDAMIARARITGMVTACVNMMASTATGLILVLGAFEIMNGRGVTPGTVVACLSIAGFLVHPLKDVARVQEYRSGARVSLEKIRAFLNMGTVVSEVPGAPALSSGKGVLFFEQVTVKGAIKSVQARTEPGSVVAVVGPNGAGKTTLLSLAARLMDPDEGHVLLDGQDISLHSLASVRKAIGVVGQEFPLLRGSIEMNLRYRWPGAPDSAVKEVSRLCGVDELLAGLPEGAKTRISEGGTGLSVGQRQRVALARALLGYPRLLLLDEVDSHLDPVATRVIDEVLENYPGTVLLVTHRVDRLRSVNAIWYMESGELVGQGTPAELLKEGGVAARLLAPTLALAR